MPFFFASNIALLIYLNCLKSLSFVSFEFQIHRGRKILSTTHFDTEKESQHHMMMMLRNAIAMVQLENDNLISHLQDPIPLRDGKELQTSTRKPKGGRRNQKKKKKKVGIRRRPTQGGRPFRGRPQQQQLLQNAVVDEQRTGKVVAVDEATTTQSSPLPIQDFFPSSPPPEVSSDRNQFGLRNKNNRNKSQFRQNNAGNSFGQENNFGNNFLELEQRRPPPTQRPSSFQQQTTRSQERPASSSGRRPRPSSSTEAFRYSWKNQHFSRDEDFFHDFFPFFFGLSRPRPTQRQRVTPAPVTPNNDNFIGIFQTKFTASSQPALTTAGPALRQLYIFIVVFGIGAHVSKLNFFHISDRGQPAPPATRSALVPLQHPPPHLNPKGPRRLLPQGPAPLLPRLAHGQPFLRFLLCPQSHKRQALLFFLFQDRPPEVERRSSRRLSKTIVTTKSETSIISGTLYLWGKRLNAVMANHQKQSRFAFYRNKNRNGNDVNALQINGQNPESLVKIAPPRTTESSSRRIPPLGSRDDRRFLPPVVVSPPEPKLPGFQPLVPAQQEIFQPTAQPQLREQFFQEPQLPQQALPDQQQRPLQLQQQVLPNQQQRPQQLPRPRQQQLETPQQQRHQQLLQLQQQQQSQQIQRLDQQQQRKRPKQQSFERTQEFDLRNFKHLLFI